MKRPRHSAERVAGHRERSRFGFARRGPPVPLHREDRSPRAVRPGQSPDTSRPCRCEECSARARPSGWLSTCRRPPDRRWPRSKVCCSPLAVGRVQIHGQRQAANGQQFQPRRVRRAFGAFVFFLDCGRAARRGFAGRASFIVASIFTSWFVSSRHTPGESLGSEIGPMATRLSFVTGWPTALNILRICCVRPSRSLTSTQLFPSSLLRPVVLIRVISHGSVRLPSRVMPRRSLSSRRSSGTPRTLTLYVFTEPCVGCETLYASSPSFVSSTRPSER